MANPFDLAASMNGKNEVPDHAAIQDYLRTGGQNLDPATAAWCAAFVNSTLQQAGIKGTGSNLARSFLNFGTPVDTPAHGDIAVFSRGAPGSGLGHVGFVDKLNPDGTIRMLSGNHGNAVGFGNYPTAGLLGYRHPGDPSTDPQMAAVTPPVGSQPPTAPTGAPSVAGMFATSPVVAGAAAVAPVVPDATPAFSGIASMFAQQQADLKKKKEDEATADQIRRTALLSGGAPSVAGLYG